MVSRLPWVVGAGGLLVYLLTLNRWVPLPGAGIVARVSGWEWQPAVSQPLTWAVLYPFHWLPQAWIPLALNLFTAMCAGLVLMLLARSVALLPHDVARRDSFRSVTEVSILSTPTAWIPPVLAVMVCGLQLSFWEHATEMTGSMIDLLFFAYIIRCLFEFRLDQDAGWLCRCAYVYGAGIANDWALVGYLPVFVAALVWISGFGVIYNRQLSRRTVLWGLAGLGWYLWLPVLIGLTSHGELGFWEALKANVTFQKHALSFLRRPAVLVLALSSLLPLLGLSIRWKSHTVQIGDDSGLGVFFTKATVHFVHALFFVVALWIELDPGFSPRRLGLGTPMLTYYYLLAVVTGYCAGYFLAMGSSALEGVRARGVQPARGTVVGDPLATERRVGQLAAAGVWIVLGVFPVLLLGRNYGQISTTNGPCVRELARQLCADLPAGRSVVLSEDPRQLFLLRAELGAHGGGKSVLPLEAKSLASAQYHRFMAKEVPSRWPVALSTNELVERVKIIELVSAFAAQGQVVHAHPGFGLFFEEFVDRPNGLIHGLVQRGAKETLRQTLDPGMVATNEHIWQQRWTGTLGMLAEQTKEKAPGGPAWVRPVLAWLRLKEEQNLTVSAIARVYSKSLNYWGVQMQRLGRWAEAGVWFERALALNPDNLAAQINAQYNRNRQRGEKKRLEGAMVEKAFQDLFGTYRNWGEVLSANGPVDEPTCLFQAAQALLADGNCHQAGGEFARCQELAPEWAEPKLWLALSQIDRRDFASALELTESVQTSGPPPDAGGLAQLLMCRMMALQGLARTNEAAACVEGFISRYRERAEVLSTAADLLQQNSQCQGELAVLDALLRHEPNDLKLLTRKGCCELQLSEFAAAAATLTKVLSRDPSVAEARLYRAVALFGAGQLEAARDDYQVLRKTDAYPQSVLFGLGAIARSNQDTNAAMEFFKQYCSNSVPGSPVRHTFNGSAWPF